MKKALWVVLWLLPTACGSADGEFFDSSPSGAPTGSQTTSSTATQTSTGSPTTTTTPAGTPSGSPVDVAYYERSQWEQSGYEVDGPALPEEIDFIIVHYPGADLGGSLTLTEQIVQSGQRDWTDNRGYSLGYNWIVGRGGLDDLWEVRGFDYKNAANGPVDPPNPDLGTNGNDHSVSVEFVVNLDGELSPEQVEAGPVIANWLRDELGRSLEARPHSWVKPTGCPGDPMRQLLEEGWMAP